MSDDAPPVAPLRLVIYPDPILRETCTPYEDAEFGADLESYAEDMLKTMYIERGVGLAAPQVNLNRRIIAIDPSPGQDSGIVLVNPVIVESDGAAKELERCLSMPHEKIEAAVKRPEWVRVEFRTPGGEEDSVEGGGLLARVLQHEIDHLDGVLFTDRLGSMKKMTMRKYLRELEEQYGEK